MAAEVRPTAALGAELKRDVHLYLLNQIAQRRLAFCLPRDPTKK
jgi:hypothetical protein